MKNTMAAAGLAAFLALGGVAFAEEPIAATTKAPVTTCDARVGEMRDKLMARLRVTLELSDDQAQKLGGILDAWHGQMKQRRDTFLQQCKAVLTPEQQAAFEKMRQEREQRAAEWRVRHESSKGAEGKPGTTTTTVTAERTHRHSMPESLKLTPEQSRKMRALANQMRHFMKADREMMMAQACTVLSPLQEKEFEAGLARFATHAKSRFSKALRGGPKGTPRHGMDKSSLEPAPGDEAADDESVDPDLDPVSSAF